MIAAPLRLSTARGRILFSHRRRAGVASMSATCKLRYALKIAAVLSAILCAPATARNSGQWGNIPKDVSEWFQSLTQPDNGVSCCGEADAYWADETDVLADGTIVAIITDTRADAPLGRPHIDAGTRIIVPRKKIQTRYGNVTDHTWIFVGTAGQVYCYVPAVGI